MTRSFCQQSSVLLLLLTACARRDRPYVPAAPPPDPTIPRLEVGSDGSFKAAAGSKHVLLDIRGRLRMRDLQKGFVDAFTAAGVMEMEALVDTPTGEGAVPLPFPVDTSGFGYSRGGKIHLVWSLGESMDVPGARVRPGVDGAYEVIETGSLGDLKLVIEDPVFKGGSPPPPRRRGPPPALEAARFILLCAGPEDLFRDVVQSLVALEKAFPGKVVLEVLAK